MVKKILELAKQNFKYSFAALVNFFLIEEL